MRITKRELNQIYYLNRELEMWIKKKIEMEYDLKSPVLGKDYKTYKYDNAEEEKVMLRLQIAENIDRILGDIQQQRLKCYEAIQSINDSQLRLIIQFRCIELKSWQEVANKIGYGNGDSVRMAYNRAFDAFGFLKNEYIN